MSHLCSILVLVCQTSRQSRDPPTQIKNPSSRLLLIDNTTSQPCLLNGLVHILHSPRRKASIESVRITPRITTGIDGSGNIGNLGSLIDLDNKSLTIQQPYLNRRCRLRFVHGRCRGTLHGSYHTTRSHGCSLRTQTGPLPIECLKLTLGFGVVLPALIPKSNYDVALDGFAVLVKSHFFGRASGGYGAEELTVGRIVETTERTVVYRETVAVHGDGAADFFSSASGGIGGTPGLGAGTDRIEKSPR
mmetsp:Transcript_33180/g.66940  ORF Transcript_33180/g.66940 Transcript_33180/m.66940 type:complete len:247 (-) Transcript_33180:23-763(-)